MDISIDRLADIVSLRLGEFPDWRSRGHGVYDSVALTEMIEVLVEDIARDLTRTAPLSEFTSPVDIRSEIFTRGDFGDEGECLYELPEDFARLYALKMGDWGETLSDEYLGNAKSLSFGAAMPAWMAGRRTRPTVKIYNYGEKGAEMRFKPFRYSLPEEASYIPLPSYDFRAGQLRKIDPGLLKQLCLELAELIKSAEG